MAVCLPTFTISSTRVTFGMFFKSLAKILEKGVAQPSETEIFIYKLNFTKIYGKVVCGTSAIPPVRS
jgi:hypothetical protein